MSEQIPSQAWQQAEKNINKAERANRKGARASSLLHEKTWVTKEKRRKKPPELPAEKNRVLTVAQEREQTLEKEVKQLLGEVGSLERSLVVLQKKNLIAALREDRSLTKRRRELTEEENAILENLDTPGGSGLEALEDIRTELNAVTNEYEMLVQSSPEAFYGLHLKELKEYKKELKHGRIVETPYVQNKAEDIVAHLQANRPVLVYGHFGSGKTELAMHVARK